MKHYILDAYNILHKNGAWSALMKRSPDAARSALIEAVTGYASRYLSCHFTIVFDGSYEKGASLPRNITVRGTHARQTADEVIKEAIRREAQPALCTVVSSDTELYKYARVHTCTPMTAEEFLRDIASPVSRHVDRVAGKSHSEEKPSGVSKSEIAEMKRLFGLK